MWIGVESLVVRFSCFSWISASHIDTRLYFPEFWKKKVDSDHFHKLPYCFYKGNNFQDAYAAISPPPFGFSLCWGKEWQIKREKNEREQGLHWEMPLSYWQVGVIAWLCAHLILYEVTNHVEPEDEWDAGKEGRDPGRRLSHACMWIFFPGQTFLRKAGCSWSLFPSSISVGHKKLVTGRKERWGTSWRLPDFQHQMLGKRMINERIRKGHAGLIGLQTREGPLETIPERCSYRLWGCVGL